MTKTRAVRVGRVVIGGGRPVVVQSMTTTTPDDLPRSLEQVTALARAGCRIVRLAVPSQRAADALPALRRAMRAGGLHVPLVADVHFSAGVALAAAPHVEKVRINPGNFAAGPRQARRNLAPLLEILRARGAALRIGVNHGSLAPYLADRFGHGPEGMVASALEYLRLCREREFAATVVSLKASDPALMVEANRLLAARMAAEGFHAPIHLGVTEAGEGAEGALRSAVAMGALLLEGIGDTIRVSLAGDPVAEIPVCRAILRGVRRAREPRLARGTITAAPPALLVRSIAAGSIGRSGALARALRDRRAAIDAICVRAPGAGRARTDETLARELRRLGAALGRRRAPCALWLEIDPRRIARLARAGGLEPVDRLCRRTPRHGDPAALLWSGRPRVATGRALAHAGALVPTLPADPWEAAVTLGSLLLDGRAAGILVEAESFTRGASGAARALGLASPARLASEILQATRRRLTHAEFIACPGCGRLHYDLAPTVRRLKRRLAGARGVKIAVMGCAVNGPGEMLDADYGYVGAAAGRVDLYESGRRVARGLTPAQADRALLARLRASGRLA
jgi:(E)-4-hydroxy-3-methylbut-2-enyl-diphosphate synthase